MVIDIERGEDGRFRCICTRCFTLSSSLHRHARSCEGDISQDELREELSEKEIDDDSEEYNLLIDCVGKFHHMC